MSEKTRLSWRARTYAAAFLLTAVGLNGTPFAQESETPKDCEGSAIELEVVGDFVNEDGPGEDAAKDLSGIACDLAGGADQLRCLVVNDENVTAQWASISEGQITPGTEVPLIKDGEPPTALGTAPTTESWACSGGEDLGEFDGEAVAFEASSFYVAGSHGCSRNSKEFRLSSFLVAKVTPGTDGTDSVALTYRLSDALLAAEPVNEHFGKDLSIVENGVPKAVGLNVEGIAIDDGKLMAGLRAPSIGGEAFIVSAPLGDLFAEGDDPLSAPPEVRKVQLGTDIAIRDMTMLRDGRLLILSGPTLEQDLPYTLSVASPDGAILQQCRLGDIPNEDWKAEGIAEIGEEEAGVTVLVLFDDPENGKPRAYKLPLP